MANLPGHSLPEDAIPLTRENCEELNTFYVKRYGKLDPPRYDKWSRNGKTKLWKTRPSIFKIPVKFGLYRYDYLTEEDDFVMGTK